MEINSFPVVNTSVLRSGGTDSRKWHFQSLSLPWLSRGSARHRDGAEHLKKKKKNSRDRVRQKLLRARLSRVFLRHNCRRNSEHWPRVVVPTSLPPSPLLPRGSRCALLPQFWLALPCALSVTRAHKHSPPRRASSREAEAAGKEEEEAAEEWGGSSSGSASSVARSPASSTAGRVNDGAGRCAALSGASGRTDDGSGAGLQVLPTLELDAAHLPQAPPS